MIASIITYMPGQSIVFDADTKEPNLDCSGGHICMGWGLEGLDDNFGDNDEFVSCVEEQAKYILNRCSLIISCNPRRLFNWVRDSVKAASFLVLKCGWSLSRLCEEYPILFENRAIIPNTYAV